MRPLELYGITIVSHMKPYEPPATIVTDFINPPVAIEKYDCRQAMLPNNLRNMWESKSHEGPCEVTRGHVRSQGAM